MKLLNWYANDIKHAAIMVIGLCLLIFILSSSIVIINYTPKYATARQQPHQQEQPTKDFLMYKSTRSKNQTSISEVRIILQEKLK